MIRLVVPGQHRMRFLPKHFDRAMMRVEGRVYDYAGRALPGYTGGSWDFIECENGAGYLRHAVDDPERPSIAWRGLGELANADVCVSSDAAGLALTTLAVNHILNAMEEGPLVDRLIVEWERLMAVVHAHPEAESLRAILD